MLAWRSALRESENELRLSLDIKKWRFVRQNLRLGQIRETRAWTKAFDLRATSSTRQSQDQISFDSDSAVLPCRSTSGLEYLSVPLASLPVVKPVEPVFIAFESPKSANSARQFEFTRTFPLLTPLKSQFPEMASIRWYSVLVLGLHRMDGA